MKDEGLPELIAAVDATSRGIVNVVRAFAENLRAEAAGELPGAGDGEREESQSAAPRAWTPEAGELPQSYGKTSVNLLVVDPTMVHAYWEVAPRRLQEAQASVGGPAQAVLRFHEESASFDVRVELESKSWYVPLWSSDKSYYVELGLKSTGDNFVSLAKSNTISTPRTMPVSEPVERFMRVSVKDRSAEMIEAPPYHKPEPERAAVPATPPAVPMAMKAGATAQPQLPAPEPGPVTAANLAPAATPAPPSAERPKLVDSAEILKKKLSELYALREWRPEPVKPQGAASEEAHAASGEPAGSLPERVHGAPGLAAGDQRASDLTDLAEARQVPGVSSGSLQQRRTKS